MELIVFSGVVLAALAALTVVIFFVAHRGRSAAQPQAQGQSAGARLQSLLQRGDLAAFWDAYARVAPAAYSRERWKEQQEIVDVLFDNATLLGIGDKGRQLLVRTRNQILDMLTGATTVDAVNASLSEYQRLVQSRGSWPTDDVSADGSSPNGDLAGAMASTVERDGGEWGVAVLRLDISLAAQLRYHAARAHERGLLPILELKADWAPPSAKFSAALDNPLLQDALRGGYLLRTDLDIASTKDEAVSWFTWERFPAFYSLQADGRPVGAPLSSAEWGPDTPESMAPVLRNFIARASA